MIKLKPNSLEKVQEWAKTMNDRKSEAMQTIINEGIEIESVFLAKVGMDDYLIYYIRTQDWEKAAKVTRESLMEIDAIHQEFKKECWESVKPVDILLDLKMKEKSF